MDNVEERISDATARYRDIWTAVDAVRTDLVALRSDIMLAKGAVRASTVIAGAIVAIIGAAWTLIQTLVPHLR
jgi:hypothetical protein